MNEGLQLNVFPTGEGEKGLEEKTVMRLENGVSFKLGKERGRSRGGSGKGGEQKDLQDQAGWNQFVFWIQVNFPGQRRQKSANKSQSQ